MATTWTLRHLLDYLDDRLDPEQTRRLGQVIEDNEGAQRIVDRLRQITRKRRLSAPELDLKSENQTGDPNVVAAYLDGKLGAAEATELEKLCNDSDEFLAEIAASHQIVSVGDSQPVMIPPMARQRMYGLVQGREAIPDRPVKLPSLPNLEYDVDGEVGEGEGDLLLEPLWQRVHRQASILLPVAALLLVVVLAALIQSLIGDEYEESLNQAGPAQVAQNVKKGEPVPEAKNPEPALEAKKAEPPPVVEAKKAEPPGVAAKKAETLPLVAVWPMVVSGLEKPDQAAWLVSTWTTSLASRPALPPNFLLGLGREELIVHAERPAPVKPVEVKPPTTAKVAPPPAAAPPAVRKLLGRHLADSQREGLLLRRSNGDDWRVVRTQSPIHSEEKLLVVPGYRNEIELANRVKLLLVGTLPTTQGTTYHYETVGTLHASEDVDLDLTLERGRAVVTGKAEGETKVRFRYLTQVWEVKLPAGGVVALECTGRVLPGTGAWTPHYKATLYAVAANLEVARQGRKETLPRGALLTWDSVSAVPGLGTIVPKPDLPAWLLPKQSIPTEAKRALTSFNDNVFRKVQNQERELAWITIACNEALAQNRELPKLLALYTLGALDQLRFVVAALDDPSSGDVRRAAQDALLHWASRQAQQDEALRQALADRGYREEEADLLLLLLRRADKADRPMIDRLLGYLKHNRLAIRDLAYQNLVTLLPTERLSGYNPTASAAQLETSVEQLRKRLLAK